VRRFGDGNRLPRLPWGSRHARVDRPPGLREITALLVSDCEAFLLGSYAQLLDERSEPVPVWAWTNLLAHGTGEDLAWATSDVHGGRFSSRRWRVARAFAASEVLAAVERGATLADVQREVLVPAELAIADQRGAWAWTPQQWLETVRSAIRASPYSSRT